MCQLKGNYGPLICLMTFKPAKTSPEIFSPSQSFQRIRFNPLSKKANENDDQNELSLIISSNLLPIMNAQQFRVIEHFNFQIAHFIDKKN